ncbi:collagenase isoform X1 [Tribolium castaneum]|uniref:Serine protease H152 n=1 Tax=Tribolium castaneum TaxID=7070 RepID=D2A5W0_TRICA|nr:PREDICTED: collagenase isoform X1 [Tribolium castaneum]EFA05682.2 serine protease H152 [Tribolium castaneum]|eukprot:XP_008194727.1 PREDICTED: collagenase isoform X1 [Tribolium castaneum]
MWFGSILTYFSLAILVESKSVPTISPISREIKVINGNDAQIGQFPWQVFIICLRSNLLVYCNGAIINEKWVLTSASCIDIVGMTAYVYPGIVNLNSSTPELRISREVLIHEDFDFATLQNDIALIKLPTDLEFNENIKPIALDEDGLPPGTSATISGWGHSSHDDVQNFNLTSVLQYAEVPVIDNKECEQIYGPDVVTSSVVCTKNPNSVKGPCLHDGGAPLVIINAETKNPIHVGIFSFVGDSACEKNYPAGYTRTAAFRNWIKEKTGV